MFFKKPLDQNIEIQNMINLQQNWEFEEDRNTEITLDIRNQILIPLIEELQIDGSSVVQLCNIYFKQNKAHFNLLNQLETIIQSIKSQQNSMHQHEAEQNKYDMYQQEYNQCKNLILKKIKLIYFQERQMLLVILNILVQQISGQNEVHQICKIFFESTLIQKHLVTNLIQSLIKNQDSNEQFNLCLNRDDLTTKIIFDNIQLEQIEILKVLLQLSDQIFDKVTTQEKDMFLDYLVNTEFDGEIQYKLFTEKIMVTTDDQMERKEMIKILGQMCGLSLLGLHVSPQPKNQLAHQFEVNQLTQSSGFIYLTLIIERNQQRQFQNKIQELPILIEVEQIMQSSLILLPQFEIIKGIIMNLLFKWLDQYYLYESQRSMPNQQIIEQIQKQGEFILKDRVNIQKFWTEGIDSLQMFKKYFQQPKSNFEQLIRLLDILCGYKKFAYSSKVFVFIEQQNLLHDYFTWITQKIQKLIDRQVTREEELSAISSACVILAKILKQDSFLKIFIKLNEEYIKISSDYQPSQANFQSFSERSPFRGSIGQQSALRDSFLQPLKFEGGEFPLISLIVKILNIFFQTQQPCGDRCIFHIIDALRKIYKTHSKEVILELCYNRNQLANSNSYQLIEQLIEKIQIRGQSQNLNYKLTCSMLHFIITMFKSDFPQRYLSQEDRTKFQLSFQAQTLICFYKPLVTNFFNFQFENLKSFTSTAYYILKLAEVLLQKFNQVKDNGQKLLICQAFPQFDLLLEVIMSVVNYEQIIQICFNLLQLTQINTKTLQLYENRFFADLNQNQKVSGMNGSDPIIQLQKVILTSLQVLNILLELGLSQNINAKVISRQSYYIRKLIPVQTLLQFIQTNVRQVTYQGKQIDIPSIIAYYVSPSMLLNVEFITKQALKFLTLSMQITKIDLYKTIIENLGPNFKKQIMAQLYKELVNQSDLSVEFLDFWIQATDTQPKLVDGLWQTFDPKILINFVDKIENILDRKVIKICVLASLMAEKKCCINILEYNSHQLISSIFKKIIEPLVEKFKKPLKLDGKLLFELSEQFKDIELIQKQIDQQNTKIVFVYFLYLVQTEFSRVPASNELRNIIQQIGSSQQFNKLSTYQKNYEGLTILQTVDLFNTQELKDKQIYDFRQQQYNHQYIKNQSSFKVDKVFENKLQSKDGCIFVTGLDCKDLIIALQKTQSYRLINSSQDLTNSNGLVGINFAIDINELDYVYQSECYHTKFKFQSLCHFQEFNLYLSELYTESLVLKAKSNFFLSIGQSMMNYAQSKVNSEMLITNSMLPIVTPHVMYQTNPELIKNEITHLIQASQQQVSLEVQIIQQMKYAKNKICVEYFDQTIQNMIVHLGVLSHFSKYISSQQQDPFGIKNLLASLMMQLPQLNGQNNDQSQKSFAQVTLLVLQILTSIQALPEETPTLRVLTQILECMKNPKVYSDGLKIYTIAIDVLKPESLKILMEKSDSTVLRNILYRLNDQNITTNEVQEVITLLQTYSRTLTGSQHLQQIKVLEKLHITDYLKNLNEKPPYVINKEKQVRNQIHIQWLQIILLIRQLNVNLIRTPKTENLAYFKQCCYFANLIQQRFCNILQVGINSLAYNQQIDTTVISVAIFEEIELTCSLFVQLFEHADLWAEIDYNTYSNIKDQMIFILPNLLNYQLQNALLPSSITEQHLVNIKNNERNGLKIKVEISQIKTLLSCASSMHNVFSLQEESSNELFSTWNFQNTTFNDNQTIFNSFTREVQENPTMFAFETLKKSMENLTALLVQYKNETDDIDSLLKQTSEFFLTNQWVQNEYKGGLGAMLIEEDVSELINIIEVTLGIGMYVLTQLLDRARNQLSNGINNFQQFEYSHYQKQQQQEYLEERVVVNFANQLRRLIETVYNKINFEEDQDKKVWGDKPFDYMTALQAYVISVEENPTILQQFNY